MNQQEWIEYFELVNGRKPTPAELAQAQAAGEFILERPDPAGERKKENHSLQRSKAPRYAEEDEKELRFSRNSPSSRLTA